MARMNFEALHTRLIDLLRLRIRNGVVTERQLARITGVSQPHMHNVLKGIRYFSFHSSDQVLEKLHITVLDLIDEPFAAAGARVESGTLTRARKVPPRKRKKS